MQHYIWVRLPLFINTFRGAAYQFNNQALPTSDLPLVIVFAEYYKIFFAYFIILLLVFIHNFASDSFVSFSGETLSIFLFLPFSLFLPFPQWVEFSFFFLSLIPFNTLTTHIQTDLTFHILFSEIFLPSLPTAIILSFSVFSHFFLYLSLSLSPLPLLFSLSPPLSLYCSLTICSLIILPSLPPLSLLSGKASLLLPYPSIFSSFRILLFLSHFIWRCIY